MKNMLEECANCGHGTLMDPNYCPECGHSWEAAIEVPGPVEYPFEVEMSVRPEPAPGMMYHDWGINEEHDPDLWYNISYLTGELRLTYSIKGKNDFELVAVNGNAIDYSTKSEKS